MGKEERRPNYVGVYFYVLNGAPRLSYVEDERGSQSMGTRTVLNELTFVGGTYGSFAEENGRDPSL